MRELLNRTFGSAFSENSYKELVVNLFNGFDFSQEHSLKDEFNQAERDHLNEFTYHGSFEDTEKKSLDVLIVELKGSSKVERARSLQRNLIGKHLKKYNKDAALVAFYSKKNPDWRLSFVKMDYRFTEKGIKVEVGTPPKRYSFLVGKTEPSHTAQTQFKSLIDDKVIPTIDTIEEIFSIEKVTKEFYVEIAKRFTELVGGERKLGSKKMVEKGLIKLPSTDDDTVKKEFAVRLIGRLLFCWFLKKKKSEAGLPLLREEIISSSAVNQVSNYYHEMLERLFSQVLNTPTNKRIKEASHGYWPKIPFLNGGLFEPHRNDYYEIDALGKSKYLNNLIVPDEWLRRLFELFELYNFTIDESTSIDMDISVDPEMLGRIFENLLAEINPETGKTARKSTGSYYTPRPIVEYMVDESLKQYLKTQTGIDEDKLSILLSYAEDATDISDSEKETILDALDSVKIIDPACGSGAFPMGILQKMLLVLQKIDPQSKKWLSKKLSRIDNRLLRKEMEEKLKRENWDYIHKLGIIQNSIYGVDIQTIAVEIAKLRFFLSLIVDEKIIDDKPNRGIIPLPNLEFKFVAANSLIGLPKAEGGFAESHSDIAKLKKLRDSYFTCWGDEKRHIELEFDETQERMFKHSLEWTTKSQTYKLSEWKPFSDEASSWFDPEWMFGISDGFDIAIANPPYIRHEAIKPMKPQLKDSFGSFFCGTADIYTYFYKNGLEALKQSGHLCFIAPNKFMRAGYGKNTRTLLTTEATPKVVIDFCDLPIFDATTYPSIILVSKNPPSAKDETVTVTFSTEDQLDNIKNTTGTMGFKMPISALRPEGWNLERPEVLALMDKLRKTGKPLGEYVNGRLYRGILTGLNKAFVIDAATRKRLIEDDPKSEELIKPWLRGKDIKRWQSDWAGLYVINIPSSANKLWAWSNESTEQKARMIFKKTYPAVHDHLSQWEDNLIKRDDQGKFWWELRSCAYYGEFEKPKITWGNLSTKPKFAFDNSSGYVSAPANIIPTEDLTLLAILNSPICKWLIGLQAAVRSGGFLEYKPMYVESIPIAGASDKHKTHIIERVKTIITNPNSPAVSRLEAEINKMVYDLYELTPEEIQIIDESVTSNE